MKKKMKHVAWVMFTVCVSVFLFLAIIGEPPREDPAQFKKYLIFAAIFAVIYPAMKLVLGFVNSYLYEELKQFDSEYEKEKSTIPFRDRKRKAGKEFLPDPDVEILVSALNDGRKLTEKEQEELLEFLRERQS